MTNTEVIGAHNMNTGLIRFVLDLPGRISKVVAWVRSWKFRQIFGNDVTEEFHIIHILYESPDKTIHFRKPESKVPRTRTFGGINLSTVNSCATTRALGYLVYGLGENTRIPLMVQADNDADADMDLSFVSIGGVTNFKTVDLLDNSSNVFLDVRVGSIVAKDLNLPLVTFQKGIYDYGFIIKIHPAENIHRTWICCGGFGEWGTSGAAWYLAKRWKEIRRFAKRKEFAYITKTRGGADEQTAVVHRFLTREEVESTAKTIQQAGNGN
jgi:hypothetical protein